MSRPSPKNEEKSLRENDFIVSKTDLKGRITYGNKIFTEMSGYSEHELLGTPHNILRHPDMPKIVFKLLWDRIQSKQEIFAYVKNITKTGAYYWVFTNVTPSLEKDGSIRGYYSVRRKPNSKAISEISEVYKILLGAEKRGGMGESEKVLNEFLKEKGLSYDEYIISLQRQ